MTRFAILLAAAAVGLVVGLVVAAAAGGTRRAEAVIQVLPAGETTLAPARRLALEVQAATYAELLERRSFLEQIRPQVLAARLSTDELGDRIAGEHVDGTALVELKATGPTADEARSLASDVAAALLGYVQQSARQRAAAEEDELRRRIDELNGLIAAAASRPARLEALREERAALNAALATLAGESVDQGTRLAVAGSPALEPGTLGPSLALWGVVGAVAGLLLALLALRAVPAVPALRLPRVERAAEPEAVLVEPRAGAVLTGAIPVRAQPDGRAVEWSRDGSDWTEVGAAEWQTAALPDGRYLLRLAGTDAAIPVELDNTPPSVALVAPAETIGPVLLRADASDAGSGIASIEFMLSDGGADWTTIAEGVEAEWDPAGVPPGVYWLCAVARDRAGLPAASDPQPLRVRS